MSGIPVTTAGPGLSGPGAPASIVPASYAAPNANPPGGFSQLGTSGAFPSGIPGSYGAAGPAPNAPPGFYPPQTNPGAQQPLIPNGPQYGLPQTGMYPQAQPQQIVMPHPENKIFMNAGDLSIRRLGNSWQLWLGPRLFRDFGDNESDARDALRVYHDLRPTEWVAIGAGKPIVEYGLVNGRPYAMAAVPGQQPAGAENGPFPLRPAMENRAPTTDAGAQNVTPVDLRTVRIEPIKGVWCLRDDYNILINFGVDKDDADQALAAVRRYGFNRLGAVGHPTPLMTYFYASPDAPPPTQGPLAKAALQFQIDSLAKVGIPVGGLGYVGEMIRFDPRTVSVRKEGGDWQLAAGVEVLAHFGPSEWIARDAARTIQDAHFTEFCTVGSSRLTFFLVNGQAPTNAPLSTQGRTFDPGALRVNRVGERWAVTENGRYLFPCASPEEGQILVRLVQYYQFNQLCHLGPTPAVGVSFLARIR